jgi:hypothetical protein
VRVEGVAREFADLKVSVMYGRPKGRHYENGQHGLLVVLTFRSASCAADHDENLTSRDLPMSSLGDGRIVCDNEDSPPGRISKTRRRIEFC